MRRTRALSDLGRFSLPSKGSETRSRIIKAAIEVFASLGFAGASTRALSERAEVNPAVIFYHFGGRRELYLAAAQTIADTAREIAEPIIARLSDRDRAEGAQRIAEALSGYFHFLVGGSELRSWDLFFLRCEREGDEAFRLIYDEAVGRFACALIEATAEILDSDPENESVRMRVAIVLASVLNMRTLRNVTLSNLGWDHLETDALQRLEQTFLRESLGILLSVPT